MREQLDNEMLMNIAGGAIDFIWSKDTQSGTVSSNITGETYTFGADKFDAVFQYVVSHQLDPDVNQMNAIAAIINS